MSTAAADPSQEEQDNQRDHMPRWIPRLLILIVITAYLAFGAFQLLGKIRDLLVWLLISLFLSFALEPAVNWLVRHGWKRGLATFGVLFALFVLGVVILGAMVPLLIDQVYQLIDSLPGWLDSISKYTEEWFGISVSSEKLTDQLISVGGSIQDVASNVAGSLLGFGARVLTAVLQMLTIALFTFYIVTDGPRLRRAICSTMPPQRQKEVLRAWEIAVDKTGGYLYSRLLLGTISGVTTWIVLTALGVPFAIPLALWMGVISQFVPVVGTYLAAAVPLIVALLEDPADAAVFLVFVIIYQQIENYLLSPRIAAKTMQLHPAVAFGAALAGGSILGAIGAFLALPTAAIIQAFSSAYIHRHDVVDSELTNPEDSPDADERKVKRKRVQERRVLRFADSLRHLGRRADDEDSTGGGGT
ncbi:MAG: AI-2E family transporter [Actinomycetota bacterium]